jgi:hypothetical protein
VGEDPGVPALVPITKKLELAQSALLRAADAISAEQWQSRPAVNAWSAGELIGHLMCVERAVIGSADRYTQKPPKHFPVLKRWHLPMMLVEARVIRRKSPIPLDPAMLGEKEEMLAELREVRERTLAFIEETRGRDLSVYRWPHPFLGCLNAYEWMVMIAAHEIRHTKQMKEIAGKLPKVIAILQK